MKLLLATEREILVLFEVKEKQREDKSLVFTRCC